MSFNRDFTSIGFLPENLRQDSLYVKFTEVLDYIVQNAAIEFEDIKYKNRDPNIINNRVIEEVIKELGFGYIVGIMDTLTNFEFNVLIEFVSLINLLKGSRQGLELVLKFLGFDTIISEWWEQDPKGTPYTYNLTVIMNTSYVPNIYDTLAKIKIFAKEYIFPVIGNLDFKFTLSFATKNITVAGFIDQTVTGQILQRA